MGEGRGRGSSLFLSPLSPISPSNSPSPFPSLSPLLGTLRGVAVKALAQRDGGSEGSQSSIPIRDLLLNGRHCTTQSGPLSCNPVAWDHHVVIKNYFGSNTRRGMCLPVDFPTSSRRSKQIMLRRSKCSMGRAIKWYRSVGT